MQVVVLATTLLCALFAGNCSGLRQPRAQPTYRFLDKTSALDTVGTQRQRFHRAESDRLPRWASGLHLKGTSVDPYEHYATPSNNRVLRVSEFGADPSGRRDSLAAFQAVLKAAWSSPSGQFTNGPDNSAIIDLEGGSYIFSSPLVFPPEGGGGVVMRDGVIRAAPTFPMDNTSALLMLTANNASSSHDSACCWYEFIYFTNLVLDASLRAGCARVHGATRIIFDETFFTGYRTTGLYYGSPSHQLLVSRSFFGTSDWRGLPGEHEVCETMSHAWQNIGLHVDGPDNQIEDSVFFCSGIGIKLTGSANYFEGVHAFTGAAETYPLGAVYVPAKGASDNTAHGEEPEGQHGNRFDHCYWDYSGIRIENPRMIEFSNNYIIGLPSRQPDPTFVELVAVGDSDSIQVTGVRFTGNVFRSAGAHASSGVLHAFKLNETNGAFDRQGITNTLIEGNSYNAVKGAATRVQRSVGPQVTTIPFRFDLCDDLLFSNQSGRDRDEMFAYLQSSVRVVVSDSMLPELAPASSKSGVTITNATGCIVEVRMTTMSGWSQNMTAIAYLSVDQSRDDLGCHGAGCHPREGEVRVL